MFGIPPEALSSVQAALLFIVIVGIVSLVAGLLIPRWVLTRLLKAERQRSDDYQELYNTERKRSDVLEDIARELTVVAETTNKIVKALPTPHQETTA